MWLGSARYDAYSGEVKHLAFSSDAELLAVGGDDSSIYLVRPSPFPFRSPLNTRYPLRSNIRSCRAHIRRSLAQYGVVDGALVHKLPTGGPTSSLAWSPNHNVRAFPLLVLSSSPLVSDPSPIRPGPLLLLPALLQVLAFTVAERSSSGAIYLVNATGSV